MNNTPTPAQALGEVMALSEKATPGHWVTDDTLRGRLYSDDATGGIIAQFNGFQYAPRPAEEINANVQIAASAVNFIRQHGQHFAGLEAAHQLLRESRDAYRHDAEALLQINSAMRTSLEAAEADRDGWKRIAEDAIRDHEAAEDRVREAEGLLREVHDCLTLRRAWFPDRVERIAAFLAARGGAQ